jgi:hypothetical protein
MRLHKSPTGRIKDGPLQHLGPAETHLPLRGMNIAIDKLEIHVDVKDTGWVLTALDNPKVSFAKRLLDRQTVNRTPVENHDLEKAIATSLPRAPEKSTKPDSVCGKIINLEKLGQISATKQVPDANRQAFSSWKRDNGTPLTPALEGYRGIRERDSLQPMNDMGGLCLLATKKLPASGKVVKEIAHLDMRSSGNADFTHCLNLASGDNDFGARFRARLASRQPESRDAGYAGQCLAAKTHRAHARKI